MHKYKFLCSSRQCGKTFGSLESLKKHRLRHGEMKYFCQVCGQNFPFASDLASHASIHSAEKKFKCTYPKCVKMYQTKAEYNRHYNYRHKQKSAESQEIKCKMCDKMFSKVKYLKEHMKSHMDHSHLGTTSVVSASNGGKAANYTLMKNIKRKVLMMNSKLFFFYLVVFWNLCMPRNCSAVWGSSLAYPGQETTRCHIAFLYIFFFML